MPGEAPCLIFRAEVTFASRLAEHIANENCENCEHVCVMGQLMMSHEARGLL